MTGDGQGSTNQLIHEPNDKLTLDDMTSEEGDGTAKGVTSEAVSIEAEEESLEEGEVNAERENLEDGDVDAEGETLEDDDVDAEGETLEEGDVDAEGMTSEEGDVEAQGVTAEEDIIDTEGIELMEHEEEEEDGEDAEDEKTSDTTIDQPGEELVDPRVADNENSENKGIQSHKTLSKENDNLAEVADESVVTRKRAASVSSHEDGPTRKLGRSASSESNRDTAEQSVTRHDDFCWVCHKDVANRSQVDFRCQTCPRSYHIKCICMPENSDGAVTGETERYKPRICPECVTVMNAEEVAKRSEAMKLLTMDHLVRMLKQICDRMRRTPGAEPFLQPVQPSDAHDYYDYIVYPMDIQTLEDNVEQMQYGSTESFLADAQWIVHNSIIFNSSQSPYTNIAKRLLKVCKQELAELETCPECYTKAHTKSETWFVEACRRPHILVWAKLKGFPFWPAKAMKIKDDQVDVRFFGAHDRAWVYLKDCFLYSEEMPTAPAKKNGPLLAAIDELNTHVERLTDMYGEVTFASVRTPLGKELSTAEIQKLVPKYHPERPQASTRAVSDKLSDGDVPKGPVTLTISSLKSNPVVVLNKSELPSSEPAETTSVRSKEANDGADDSVSVTSSSSSSDSDEESVPARVETSVGDSSAERNAEVNPTSRSDSDPEAICSNEQNDDDLDSRVPNGEILANALGLRRIKRKPTDENTTPPKEPGVAFESTERRSLRSSLSKIVGEDDRHTSNSSILQQQLRKASLTPAGDESLLVPAVIIKAESAEASDQDEMDVDDKDDNIIPVTKHRKTHDFMEQISTQAQTKPGIRFNISKDISISAISKDEVEEEEKQSGMGGNRTRKIFPVTPNITVNPAHAKEIIEPQKPMQSLDGRNRFTSSPHQHQPATRFLNAANLSRMVRPISSTSGGKINVTYPNVPRPRAVPGAIQMSKFRSGQGNMMRNFTKEAKVMPKSSAVVQAGQAQGSQGAITLPGGTITVTPLSASTGVNGDRNVSGSQKSANSSTSNGVPVSIIDSGTGNTGHNSSAGITTKSSSKAINSLGPTSRKVTSMVPITVVHTVQNLQKNVSEMIRQAAESIAVDMVEHAGGKSDGDKNYKQENDKLVMRHTKELADMRLNHEVSLRELRSSMETEKKRALNDLRKLLELEKQKAIDEAKRKQWCANCLREALFYCCWNTSYCGYSCQEEHWPTHMTSCTQNAGGSSKS